MQRRLAAVLAADVAGYSRLMGLDEEGTLARLKAVRKSLIDPTIASHRGRIQLVATNRPSLRILVEVSKLRLMNLENRRRSRIGGQFRGISACKPRRCWTIASVATLMAPLCKMRLPQHSAT